MMLLVLNKLCLTELKIFYWSFSSLFQTLFSQMNLRTMKNSTDFEPYEYRNGSHSIKRDSITFCSFELPLYQSVFNSSAPAIHYLWELLPRMKVSIICLNILKSLKTVSPLTSWISSSFYFSSTVLKLIFSELADSMIVL